MMTWFRVLLIGQALALSATLPAAALERRDETRVLFGKSPIHHLTGSDTSTVPHRLAPLAWHASKDFAADGRWGFLRNVAADPPARTERESREATRVGPLWSTLRVGLCGTCTLNAGKRVRGAPPKQLCMGENVAQQPFLGATLAGLDWIDANSEDSRFIREGWPTIDADLKVFPPSRPDVPRLVDCAPGAYQDESIAVVEEMRAVRSRREIDLIPVGRAMADALSPPHLAALPPETLFPDLSPLGMPMAYLLAAKITYAAPYGEHSPAGSATAGEIALDFAGNREAPADLVRPEMQQADA